MEVHRYLQKEEGRERSTSANIFTVHIFIVFIRIHPSMHCTGKRSLHGSGSSAVRSARVSSRTVLRYLHTNKQIKQAAPSSIRVKAHFVGRHGSGVQGHSPGRGEEGLGSSPQGGFSYAGSEIHRNPSISVSKVRYSRHAEEEGICPTQRAEC